VSDAIGPGEAARRLGVSTRTVQRWLRDGRLPAIRIGSRLKVDGRALADIGGLPPELPVGVTPAVGMPAAIGSGQPGHTIGRLLIANRGELVVRIARTCRRLGIRSLALVPDDQARAWWTGAADELVPLQGSYLDVAAVLAAARASGADAIHPGYGFLAEGPVFAEAVIDAGLGWVGPPAAAMRALGDKAAARQLAAANGIPILPGYDGRGQSDAVLGRQAARIGFPLLVKPAAGGGGMGMHLVREPAELPDALARARREATAAFGDDRLVLERYLEHPRHVEVQVLADTHGNAVHLGERECSLQRRHQKVIEEAPSPAVDIALRTRLGEAALRLARAAGYQGAGTAEFLLGDRGDYYFLELNARLQVEHPVTELVTGRDLVADQLAICAGQALRFGQADVTFTGHAIEARIYAEDPDSEFLPATGEVIDARWPQLAGVRVDAGVGPTDVIGTRYDPLLAKLIAHADDRLQALALLDAALAETSVVGLTTNRGFLRWLIALPEMQRGVIHTQLIDEQWQPQADLPERAWAVAAAALDEHARRAPGGATRMGFRLNAAPRLRVEIDGLGRAIELEGQAAALNWRGLADGSVVLDLDGRSVRARLASPPTVEDAIRHASHEGATTESVRAPMPGSVLEVRVEAGQQVEAGQVLVVLEAMKMENGVPAPSPATVAGVLVEVGQQVQRGQPLVELA
jgi:acetyl-CoA/propionyl-CoA carboxylase, biotin carboxylase, biotin carboxyl carrier protein